MSKKPNLAFIVAPEKVNDFFKIVEETPKCVERSIKRVEAKIKSLQRRTEINKCILNK